MIFPIADLLNQKDCENWLLAYFHPAGLKCPTCQTAVSDAHVFRHTRKSQLVVYRCNQCQTVYNLYSRTSFQQRHFTPQQVVLFLRGVLKGETSQALANELGVSYQTVLDLRHDIQANAAQLQPNTALADHVTETDEMFQNAGEKR
jgi:transposase-like protein